MHSNPRHALFFTTLLAALVAVVALPGTALAGGSGSTRNAGNDENGMDWSGYEYKANDQDQNDSADRNRNGSMNQDPAEQQAEDEEWYDPTDWFDEDNDDQVRYDYDEYWFDPAYHMDQGYYTSWEWDTDRKEWVDSSDQGDMTTNPVGPYYNDFDYDRTTPVYAGQEYRWNSRSDRWEPVRSYAFWTDSYQQNTSSEQQQKDREQANRNQSRNQQTKTITGTIQGFRHLNLSGVSDQHTLVKLRLRNRDNVIVDLGPRTDLDDLSLSKSDTITIRGRTGTIDGRDVLMARTFTVNGNSHQVRMTSGNRTNDRVVQGQVEDSKEMQTKQGRSDHTFLKVRMDNGRSVVLDLGPNIDRSDIQIERGDRLSAMGQRSDVNGRAIFVARSFILGEGNSSSNQEMNSNRNEQNRNGQNRNGQTDWNRNGQNRNGQNRNGRNDWSNDQSDQSDQSGRSGRDYNRNVNWNDIETSDGQYSFHGFVGDWKKLNIDESGRPSTLVQLCLEDNRCVIVNLGPDTSLDDLGLERGDWIWVRGTRKNVNGQSCLQATRINVEGETIKSSNRDYDEYD